MKQNNKLNCSYYKQVERSKRVTDIIMLHLRSPEHCVMHSIVEGCSPAAPIILSFFGHCLHQGLVVPVLHYCWTEVTARWVVIGKRRLAGDRHCYCRSSFPIELQSLFRRMRKTTKMMTEAELIALLAWTKIMATIPLQAWLGAWQHP